MSFELFTVQKQRKVRYSFLYAGLPEGGWQHGFVSCYFLLRQFGFYNLKLSTMWIEREIDRELIDIASSFPVLVLVGPWQKRVDSLDLGL